MSLPRGYLATVGGGVALYFRLSEVETKEREETQ